MPLFEYRDAYTAWLITHLILLINNLSTTGRPGTDATSRAESWSVVAPASTTLPVGTIPRHVASIATDSADNVGGVVLLLRTLPFPVANLPTVLTGLVFIVTQSTVQCSKLSKLVALQLVLAFRNGGRLDKRTRLERVPRVEGI